MTRTIRRQTLNTGWAPDTGLTSGHCNAETEVSLLSSSGSRHKGAGMSRNSRQEQQAVLGYRFRPNPLRPHWGTPPVRKSIHRASSMFIICYLLPNPSAFKAHSHIVSESWQCHMETETPVLRVAFMWSFQNQRIFYFASFSCSFLLFYLGRRKRGKISNTLKILNLDPQIIFKK